MTRIRAAFIALLIASVALAAYGDRISGNGPEFMPRDPGAARQNLSNVDAATGRSALGLGTMATEASTDYVATGTFTGHAGDKANPHEVTYTQTGALASSAKAVDSDKLDGLDSTDYVATSTLSAHVIDNSDVHGCTAIASASAVADALSAANASDALNLRLDGSRAMTGNLKFSGNYGILQSTSAGADNGYVYFWGGGAFSAARGGGMYAYGNDSATYGGSVVIEAGNVSTGHLIFRTQNTERMRIAYGGKVGIGTDSPTHTLHVKGGDTNNLAIDNGGEQYTELDFKNNGTTKYVHYWDNTSSQYRMYPVSGSTSIQSGNVLIGTTTDDGTNKLQVNGGAKIAGAATVGGDLTVTGASTNFRNAIKAVDGAGSGLDADTVPNATPASAGAAGTAGMIRYDANYIYICVAANTWKRAAISTW